ncbi:site-specific integrase [Salipiger sp. PrR002]|uniref:site-specific integrase n=1 Tax=Salipiger sp. PrR002 TaxID=2706489 RepID=UPI0013BE1DD2|nr:site-specific integrase [Salipiger sp. PrR002]NDW00232.1 site-specific integrase [Salipiger sp. PrR002]NDW58630.1 site-specific integrase [Salipiger sp. PrR004]
MKHDRTLTTAAGPTFPDFLEWGKEAGESRDTILEIEKVATRLDLTDEELDLIPADLSYFEKVVAVSPYGAVSRSKNLEAARNRGNSRVRAALGRFLAALGQQAPDAAVRASHDRAIDFMVENEGFVEGGALFTTGTHRPFLLVRARSRVGLPNVDQVEFDRLWMDATPDGRKSLRKFAQRIAELRRGHNQWPELADLLPRNDFAVPVASHRARRIEWKTLPDHFIADAEEVFRQTLRQPSDIKAWAKEQIELGRSAVEIHAEIAERMGEKKKLPKNIETAIAGYRQATTWLLRESHSPDSGFAGLTSLRDLFTIDALQTACEAQIARSEASLTLKDPDESSTLWSRFTNLTTVARHGLRDAEILARIKLVRMFHSDYMLSPIEMTADAEAICDRLRKSPHLAATFVNAPARLRDLAARELAKASTGSRHERALRLSACAAAYAVQVSRALRPANLFMIRQNATAGCPRNLTWIQDREHAEIKFSGGEVKNGQTLIVNVLGADARILWEWERVHRPALMELRGISASPYLFPGTGAPRLRKSALNLPTGCMSVASIMELWDLGDRQLGLGLTPHQCRHALATLMLAVRPGDFASVASVLANTEQVAKRHYGKDSGEAAAVAVRESLLAHHPDIFARMKRRT